MKKWLFILILFFPIILNIYTLLVNIVADFSLLDYFLKKRVILLIVNSFFFSFIVTTFCMIFGAVVSIGYFKTIESKKKLYLLILFLLFSINPIIYLTFFKSIALFNSFSAFWQSVIVLSSSLIFLWSLISIFILESLNYEEIRAGLMVSSKWNILKYIIKPRLLFSYLLASIVVFVLAFSNSEIASILGYRTYSEEFLAQISLMDSLDLISIIALPYYLLATLFLFIIWFFVKRYSIEFRFRSYKKGLKGKSNTIALGILGTIFVTLVIFLGYRIDFNNIYLLFKENIEVLFNSIFIGFIVAIVAFVFSILIYKYLFSYGIIAILLFVFLTPSALVGFGIIEIMQFFNIENEISSFLFFIFGNSIKLIPIGVIVLAIMDSKEMVDRTLELLPISKKDIFFKIVLPLNRLKWLFVISILLVFALNQLSISILLVPVGFDLIIIKIYNLLHYGDYLSVTFLSILQIMMIVLVMSIVYRISR